MHRILVVEDSPEISALMSLTLRMEGFEVAQASDGTSALWAISQEQPDLILMDVMIPGLTGFEVAQKLKADPATRSIPIIFVTARYDVDDRVRGLEVAEDYISKPFAVPELIARVRVAVRRTLRNRPQEMNAQNKTVFLCHATEDKDQIRLLDKRLTEAGIVTWLDEKDLLPGQDWNLEISKALKASAIVLACISTKSINKRGYVQKEITMALDVLDQVPEGQIFLIPVMLEDCQLPARLSSRQAVRIYQNDGFEKLVKAVRYQQEQNG